MKFYTQNSIDSYNHYIVCIMRSRYLLPDPQTDPPELQFYRIRPSLIPGTESSRVWAHILQCLLHSTVRS
jgi:hypothetical protein